MPPLPANETRLPVATRSRPARPRQGQVTRERILEEAEAVFSRSGFSGANLSEIASRVGIRKASLYYHFPTKSELYSEVLQAILAELRAMLLTALEQPGSPGEQIDQLADSFVDLVARKPQFAILAFRELVDRNVDIAVLLRDHVHPMLSLVTEYVQDRQRRGIFQAFDPPFVLIGSVGMILFYFAAAPVVLSGYGAVRDPLGAARVAAIKAELKRVVREAVLA